MGIPTVFGENWIIFGRSVGVGAIIALRSRPHGPTVADLAHSFVGGGPDPCSRHRGIRIPWRFRLAYRRWGRDARPATCWSRDPLSRVCSCSIHRLRIVSSDRCLGEHRVRAAPQSRGRRRRRAGSPARSGDPVFARPMARPAAFRDRPPGLALGGLGGTVHAGAAYPHNMIVETLSQTGVVGFLVAAATIAMPLITVMRNPRLRGDPVVAQLVGVLVFYLVSAQFSGDLQINRDVWTFVFLLAATPAWLCTNVPEDRSPDRNVQSYSLS